MNMQKQNPASCSELDGVHKAVLLKGENAFDTSKASAITPEQIDGLLDLLPPRAYQARRFIQLLGLKPYSLTNVCNKIVLSVNLSDLAIKYNPYLKQAGYQISCRLPNRQIKNRHGEPTMLHEWFLQRVEVADA